MIQAPVRHRHASLPRFLRCKHQLPYPDARLHALLHHVLEYFRLGHFEGPDTCPNRKYKSIIGVMLSSQSTAGIRGMSASSGTRIPGPISNRPPGPAPIVPCPRTAISNAREESNVAWIPHNPDEPEPNGEKCGMRLGEITRNETAAEAGQRNTYIMKKCDRSSRRRPAGRPYEDAKVFAHGYDRARGLH